MNQFPLRVNKYLAASGCCSRREADVLIQQGLVTVNGQKAVPGMKVKAGELVKLRNKPISLLTKKIYLALHKPVGIICTTDRTKPDNIIDYVNYPERVFPVGRLDVVTAGLIILTNDGELVNRVSRRENRVAKEYLVWLNKEVSQELIVRLRRGVDIGGYVTLPAEVRIISDKQISLTIIEGKNQQVRRMCEVVGYQVIKLMRVRIGGLCLGDLKAGKWRELSENEVLKLINSKLQSTNHKQ